MKDCLNCKHAIERDPGIDDARCYCSRMEIHIFNNQPFYCSDYEGEKNTNGDRIRQMSNEELKKFLTLFSLQNCKYCAYSQVDGRFVLCQKTKNNNCVDGLMEWLNAPADCVSQNGQNDTQADLCCKSAKEGKDNNVPAKESEGKE